MAAAVPGRIDDALPLRDDVDVDADDWDLVFFRSHTEKKYLIEIDHSNILFN